MMKMRVHRNRGFFEQQLVCWQRTVEQNALWLGIWGFGGV